MRKKILWISQLIMAVVLLIYALLSTQVFYDNLIDAARGDLKIYMNLFDENDYSLDQSGADGFSGQLSGLRVTFIDTEGNVFGYVSGGLSRAMMDSIIQQTMTGERVS